MLLSLLPLALALGAEPVRPEDQSWTIFVERAYVKPGEVVENVAIRVSDGKIDAVVPGRKPREGEDTLSAVCATAGMIDASAGINTGLTSVEQSNEVQPHLSVLHGIDLFDPRFDRQARSGVTTVCTAPMDRNVIGGLSVVLKTAGEDDLAARVVVPESLVRGAIGSSPSSGNSPAGRAGPTDFFRRRPTTRMGVEWEWRKAFYDAAAATRLPEREFPGAQILRDVLAGERTLCIQAWATQDLRTAVYLKEEMKREGLGDIDLIVDAAAEAWKEPQLLERVQAKVILPAFPADGRTGPDRAFMSWNTAKILVDAGLTIALSSTSGPTYATGLGMQAGFAMRGGLTFDQALAAVTTNPASMLGIEERVGTLEVGKDADIVLWSGQPFEATSTVVGVLVDGALVLNPSTSN